MIERELMVVYRNLKMSVTTSFGLKFKDTTIIGH